MMEFEIFGREGDELCDLFAWIQLNDRAKTKFKD